MLYKSTFYATVYLLVVFSVDAHASGLIDNVFKGMNLEEIEEKSKGIESIRPALEPASSTISTSKPQTSTMSTSSTTSGVIGAIIAPTLSGTLQNTATRIFAGPKQFPPAQYAAYSVLAFRSLASKGDKERYLNICEGYRKTLPKTSDVDVPLDQQIATVWPINNSTSSDLIKITEENMHCELAVNQYGLAIASTAINHAKLVGEDFGSKKGPFLLAWAPANLKGTKDSLILSFDFSDVQTEVQAKRMFELWVSEVEEKPELWDSGWNLDKVKLFIKFHSETYGAGILKLIGKG